MTRPDRIPCAIPFCRRTASREKFPDSAEIICGKHWRLAPKAYRRVYARAVRRFRARPSWALMNVCDRLWDRIKRDVVAAAGGVG